MTQTQVQQEYRDICNNAKIQLNQMFIYTGTKTGMFSEEIRNAALIAIHALEWLSKEGERVEVIIRKEPFTSPEYP